MSNHNPYGQAADAYSNTAAATDQRSLEGRALLRAAMKLEDLARRIQNAEKVSLEDISEAIEYNHKLWTIFVGETMNDDHPLPQEIKNNIASLGLFIFKRTKELFLDPQPEKFKAIIDINRNIASGLMKQPKSAIVTPSPLATKPQEGTRPVETATDSMV
jgi:flagellar protein FlaF